MYKWKMKQFMVFLILGAVHKGHRIMLSLFFINS